ncbi:MULTISPECIES: hypothetical protein [Paenarthrobacter]|uniref:Uncharacterized protein n=1 Tax=Paenarthrobacter ureafaciens TaxID=37931 RepID=A0AAX3EKH4_PAEUR|nr:MULTISPECIES: hypothetical protein [Paenarthrobacter]MDO5874539.1 hypothetical protein [Paenarthrobacter sp. SD-1]UYV93943.1 hypothetical protein NL395_04425 [Paenarthrobacter ureafaciens]UYV98470.1 hypothetical protein NL394_04370 [Paenarthrobacter ureafaciens]WIV29784.1 hypothetical protein QN084_15770 [Paenarthrobacter sp. R1]
MSNGVRRAAAVKTLTRFVLRARLVQEHSLASDKKVLERHAAWQISFNLVVNKATGQKSVEFKPAPLLPTEQVESAAARVRPLFLREDGVHYDKVLNALLDLTATPQHREQIEGLRSKFQVADPDYPHGRPKLPRSEPHMSNKQIAGAWLYGFLLHEDDRRKTYAHGVSAEEMLLYATRTVCGEMLATVETLHLVERLTVEKTVDLPEEIFTSPVTVTAKEWIPTGEVRAYVADVGTPMPTSLDEPLSSAWREVHDEFGRLDSGQTE